MIDNKLLLCIAGKNDIAVDAVDYVISEGILSPSNICVAINGTDLGVDTWQKSLLKYAITNQIRVISLDDIYDNEDIVFISLEYAELINPAKFKTKALYNIHFSNLPKYKGMYTSAHPILNGETESGVTLHFIDAGIDTGDIIDKRVFEITISDTARDLYFKYLEHGLELFKKNIRLLLNGTISSYPQDIMDSTYYSKSSIDYNNIIINLKKTAYEIHNQIRGYIFAEYQYPEILSYKIYKSELLRTKRDGDAIIVEDGYLSIRGIDGYVVNAYYVGVKP